MRNFDKQEFKALWSRINRKAAYSVSFEEAELVQKAVAVLNDKNTGLRVTRCSTRSSAASRPRPLPTTA